MRKIGIHLLMGLVCVFSLTVLAWAQDTEANRALIIEYNDALNFNEITPELLDQFITEEAFKQQLLMVASAFPKAGHPPIDIIAEGDKVAVRATFQAVHNGDFMGIPATGKSVNMQMIAIYTIADGKIVDHWMNADELGLMEQLGIFPPDPLRSGYDWTPSSTVTGDPGDPETNKALVRRAIDEIWNQRLREQIEIFLAPSYLFHVIPTDVAGIEGYNALLDSFLTGIPDLQFQIEDMIAEGDKVVVPITYTGTHLGMLFGIPATGRKIVFTGTCIYRIADGQIVEEWNCADHLGLITQITSVSSVETWGLYK